MLPSQPHYPAAFSLRTIRDVAFVLCLDKWILILILNGAHLGTVRTRPLTLTCKFCTHYVDYQ